MYIYYIDVPTYCNKWPSYAAKPISFPPLLVFNRSLALPVLCCATLGLTHRAAPRTCNTAVISETVKPIVTSETVTPLGAPPLAVVHGLEEAGPAEGMHTA